MADEINLNPNYLRDTQFENLMLRRIFNVLIVANPYDAFILEDDGRIEEKIFDEYASLSLRYPPSFKQVSTLEEALQSLQAIKFDLIICMPGTGDNESFDVARHIKNRYPQIPMVILTPFSHGITERMANEDLSAFEYIFCWLGNTDLLLSIIKLIEDRMNLEHDVKEGVQLILLVEDGIRYYSSILPNLYNFVLHQSQEFATEALNAHQRNLRLRGRPKIVLARTYDEAVAVFDQYQQNVLGVITDVRYPIHNGDAKDELAGIKLCAHIRKSDPFVPLIIQSTESTNGLYAKKYQADFVDKGSKKMDVDLRKAVSNDFGFGDFIFINPQTHEQIARVHNLKDLQNIIFAIPAESLLYHISHNHVSRWLYSRAIFPIAEFLKPIRGGNEGNLDEHRKLIYEAIVRYRKMKNQGVVAIFQRDRFDQFSNFARIGEGSLGGKGRGLAFMDNFLKRHPEFEDFANVKVSIPKTLVLCTDVFDEFMESNNLYEVALSDMSDDLMLKFFLKARLPERLMDDFVTFTDAVKSPIAIRSSSLLEDSHYQPFAGVYNTYMIPYADDKVQMLRFLSDAIKGVYASVFFRESKAYMQATRNVIDSEKMAVILQEVVGKQYGNHYYPSLSGVGRSLNYYPLNDEKTEEGIVSLALGLGKYIVDGGTTLRFNPHRPSKILQLSEPELALRDTQTYFYALDMTDQDKNFSVNEGFNILKLDLKDAERDGALTYIASTYDVQNQVIRDGLYPGRKIISFANILQHGVFPLAELITLSLRYGQEEMKRPVEIEFAANISPQKQQTGAFYLLQIRPIVDAKKDLATDITKLPDDNLLLRSYNAMGHGIVSDMTDVVMVKTDHFTPANNPATAEDIARINRKYLEQNRHYILIGPGRWGSSDPWLGIPVRWSHINAARVMVEASLPGYRVEPSQGTHFFQNLTSFGVGYFTVNLQSSLPDAGFLHQELLDKGRVVEETPYVKVIRFDQPLTVQMDGRKRHAVISVEC